MWSLSNKSCIKILGKCAKENDVNGLLYLQGSHFSGLTKFYDISMIFPGF